MTTVREFETRTALRILQNTELYTAENVSWAKEFMGIEQVEKGGRDD